MRELEAEMISARQAVAGAAYSSRDPALAKADETIRKLWAAINAPTKAPSREEVKGWQPIETAPKDGTPFLAYNGIVGIYHTAFTTRWTGELDEEPYEGFPCGFWHTSPGSYPFGKWDCAPTHWMPLPAPPLTALEAGE